MTESLMLISEAQAARHRFPEQMMQYRSTSIPYSIVRSDRRLRAHGLQVLAMLALLIPALSSAADLERGQALYENHCGECHDKNVHKRDSRRVVSITDVRSWVISWSAHMGLGWKMEDVDDVTLYLGRYLYDFDVGLNDGGDTVVEDDSPNVSGQR